MPGGEARLIHHGRQIPKNLFVEGPKQRVVVDYAHGLAARECMLKGALQGDQRLGPKAVCASIPEEPTVVGHIPDGGRVAFEGQDTGRERGPIGEGTLTDVAGGAGGALVP